MKYKRNFFFFFVILSFVSHGIFALPEEESQTQNKFVQRDSVNLVSGIVPFEDSIKFRFIQRDTIIAPKAIVPKAFCPPTSRLKAKFYTTQPLKKMFLEDSLTRISANRTKKERQAELLQLQREWLRKSIRVKMIYVKPVVKKTVKQSETPQSAVISDTTSAINLFDSLMASVDTSLCASTSILSVAQLPDSVIIRRLQKLLFEVEMPYNKTIIRNLIISYIDKNPTRLSTLLAQADYYFPLFDDIFAQYHKPYEARSLPYEIRYLAVIESALNPYARSRMGACGLWQFMPTTAKLHGLEVNSLIDERFDPIKATHAACVYLQELYDMFADWNLAIAAYNCGPGNIRKAIVRSGGKRDFWSIYPFLPRETRGYLPIFIAACYAMNYADEHGICHPTNPKIVCDTFQIEKRVHLQQISEVLDIDLQTLRRLNPQYTKDIIPGNGNYTLLLPEDKNNDFICKFDSILEYKADELINNRRKEIDILQKTSVSGYYSVNGVTYYKVRKGDNLGAIARKFRCSVKQLKAWNGLTSDFIKAGRTLRIGKI